MQAGTTYPCLRAVATPALPVSDLICGKPVEEAAELLPRLFNLCRAAQATAARAAFGLSPGPDWQQELRREILREHIAKLCLKWPALLSLPAVALPRDWLTGGTETRTALFGSRVRLPDSYAAFQAYLNSRDGIAPVLRAIGQVFAPHEACRATLSPASLGNVFDSVPKENSAATRQAGHAVLQCIEAEIGRGPLWSAVAVAYDLESCLDGKLPPADLSADCAIVPAARGLYGISSRVEQGRVTAFTRITPTDHLLASGGALEQTLSSLPTPRAKRLAPLVLAILDPCYPVKLKPVEPREPADA